MIKGSTNDDKEKKMITKQLEEVIAKYKITKTQNIIYGTNIPMPNRILPTPWRTYIHFEKSCYYFFYFDEEGITIYEREGENYVSIPWNQVTDFKVRHIFILGKMTIQIMGKNYHFQLNRFVLGCPFISINTRYLEENHYFYPKN